MRHMSTLALCELLTEVVAELEHRGGRCEISEIPTAWGDLTRHDDGTWHFGWYSEASAEVALRDRGRQHAHA